MSVLIMLGLSEWVIRLARAVLSEWAEIADPLSGASQRCVALQVQYRRASLVCTRYGCALPLPGPLLCCCSTTVCCPWARSVPINGIGTSNGRRQGTLR